MSGEKCACMRIEWVTQPVRGLTREGGWRCTECKRRFMPEPATATNAPGVGRVVPQPPPRYDAVYAEGVAQLMEANERPSIGDFFEPPEDRERDTAGEPRRCDMHYVHCSAHGGQNVPAGQGCPDCARGGAEVGDGELTDTQRLDWLERTLFDRHWDGCLNHPSTWRMVGPYRHTLQKMRGETLREAIDAVIRAGRGGRG